MPKFYKVQIDRMIHDRIEIVMKCDSDKSLRQIEQEAEDTAKKFPNLNLDTAAVQVSTSRIDLAHEYNEDKEAEYI